MNKSIIEVNNISKKYKIGRAEKYYSLRDVFSGIFYNQISKIKGMFRQNHGTAAPDTFWALKDVSFDVKDGEAIGIIGRNGAGKSTLLKILSRITPPTLGEIKLRGTIASLLEVGTGFHQELTGRENIYLNGAILGMKRKEVRNKLNEIIDFSEMVRFIDTPVKHYSSGMYARLAFSVAAYLESDILIVDEVLAVGDASFQKKCLGKIGDVSKKGRTVLFVSHNMGMIQSLCKRVVLLDGGRLVKIGPAKGVVDYYLGGTQGQSTAERIWQDVSKAPGDATLRLKSVRIVNAEGKVATNIDIREPVRVEIEYWNLVRGPRRLAGIVLRNDEGIALFQSFDLHSEGHSSVAPVGIIKSTCLIPGNFLTDGKLFVDLLIGTRIPVPYFHINESNVASFIVEDSYKKDGVRGDWPGSWQGVVRPSLKWERQVIR
jgi:lipopolysaccharide transport system ATP-binding protein